MMHTVIDLTEFRDKLSEVLERAAHKRERILIERRGKPLAAVISFEDLQRLEALEEGTDEEYDNDPVWALGDVIKTHTGIADLANQHNHYIYGTPRGASYHC